LGSIQQALGLGLKDIALVIGAFALIVGVLLVGVSGATRGKRWLGRLGWLALITAALALGYGSIHRYNPNSQQGGA
jgi:hypothetical protein